MERTCAESDELVDLRRSSYGDDVLFVDLRRSSYVRDKIDENLTGSCVLVTCWCWGWDMFAVCLSGLGVRVLRGVG